MNEGEPIGERAIKPTLSVDLATSTWEVFQTLPTSMNLNQLTGHRVAMDYRSMPWRRFVAGLEEKERRAIRRLLDTIIRVERITTLAELTDPDLDPTERVRSKGLYFSREHSRFLKIGFQGADPTEVSGS